MLLLLIFTVFDLPLVVFYLLLLLKDQSLFLSNFFLKFYFFLLLLLFSFPPQFITFLQCSLQFLKLFLLLLHNTHSLFFYLSLFLLILLSFQGFFLQVQLILSIVPVNSFLFDIISWFCIRDQHQKEIICSETHPV